MWTPRTGEAVVLAYRDRGAVTEQIFPVGHLQTERRYQVRDPFGLRPTATMPGSVLLSRGLAITLGRDSAAVFHLTPE